ncbi:alpha/beta fold hydrolase [Amycolatopsis pigmentata]|uniref:Alpha/beta fold hydrolase n=1 Tax=Amycolatopsis pigmentata TaxID=450801 RepID=A0ABW5FXA0_9PSEU
MFGTFRAPAVLALCCAVAGTVLAGCDDDEDGNRPSAPSPAPAAAAAPGPAELGTLSGAVKVNIEGKSVNVSCSGTLVKGRPVVVLLAGLGDGVDKMADFQKSLSEKDRVCSYDRLGEGTSDQPDGPQSIDSTGKILTGVLAKVAGDGPVVLAAHSLGGLIAARYAPDHQDKVKGLVLMEATSPTMSGDLSKTIPESATGPAADLRAQTLAANQGDNPEKLVVPDGAVRSAGNIPVEVIQHGQQYLAQAVPDYGQALERVWSDGQHAWLAVSSRSTLSTATNSGHYIYVDQPDVAVQAVQRVVSQIAG